MAAKKRTSTKTPAKHTSSTFKSNPFSAMKGFCVSGSEAQKRTPESTRDNKVTPSKPLETQGEVDVSPEDDFASAMSGIGVEPLQHADEDMEDASVLLHATTADYSGGKDSAQVSSFDADELDDAELFMHHLGKMDAVFKDTYPDAEAGADSGTARRMNMVRKGQLRPQARLDLHGCYRDEARQRVRHFLENRQREGMKTVLIITGRGQRSNAGTPVVRNEIETYLDTRAKAWVAEWGRAPKQYGGDGALIVFLRQKGSRHSSSSGNDGKLTL